jgi:alternate signal-mediated exported protein
VSTRRRPGRRRGVRQFGVAALVASCAGALLAAGTGTYATWSAATGLLGGSITAGDLQLTTGAPSWRQVTPGVAGASGTLASTPAGFLTLPGDVIEVVQPVSTYLRGDNIAGEVTVDLADSDDLDSGLIEATYRVEDADGTQVAPASGEAAVGATTVVPGLVGDDDGVHADWTVVVTVHVRGDDQWLTDATPAPDPGQWTIGAVTVQLDQVRDGVGFEATP